MKHIKEEFFKTETRNVKMVSTSRIRVAHCKRSFYRTERCATMRTAWHMSFMKF